MPNPKTVSELNEQFNPTSSLRFHEGEGGLTCARIQTPSCTGEIYLHGAHVTRWRPQGHDEVFWMSGRANYLDDKAIRGGVPICFPWFAGRTPDDHPDPQTAPSHGYARTTLWDVDSVSEEDTGIGIMLHTRIGAFKINYAAYFGLTFGMLMWVENASEEPAHFEQALHSYFTVGQVKQVQITGMESAGYLDTAGGANTNVAPTEKPITLINETDRVYTTTETCTLIDPALSRKITIEKTGSGSTVVWNPWTDKAKAMNDFGNDEWPGMLCVETANIGEQGITLAPGESHTMTTTLSVETLAAH